MSFRIGLLPIMCILHPFCIPSVLMMVLLCWGFELHVRVCFNVLIDREGCLVLKLWNVRCRLSFFLSKRVVFVNLRIAGCQNLCISMNFSIKVC